MLFFHDQTFLNPSPILHNRKDKIRPFSNKRPKGWGWCVCRDYLMSERQGHMQPRQQESDVPDT